MTIATIEQLKYENAEKFFEKPIKTIHESCFWDEDDPRWGNMGKKGGIKGVVDTIDTVCQRIDLKHDSYVWDFSGTRGAGKNIVSTFYGAWANYEFDKKIVSNYPIRYKLKVGNKTKFIESEPLDIYRLLQFDNYYNGCVVILDEAPEIIGHMMAMSWKNRLANSWIREIRKNGNSLFLGSQSISLIDKSSRWQVDVITQCKDAFRLYGSSGGLERGVSILIDMYDNSGQWTGHGIFAESERDLAYHDPIESLEIPGRIMFDTYPTDYTQNIFDSLRKVELKLDSVEIGDGKKTNYSYMIERAMPTLDAICNDGKKAQIAELNGLLGDMTSKEKTFLSAKMAMAGARKSANGNFWYFNDFNPDKFRSFAE